MAASEARLAPSTSSRDATQEQQQTDVGPSLERTHVVHSIFLSHSGQQKGFVERLYERLKNAGHDAFFDEHSIPKGTQFPERIRQAASVTEVGVVILSDDFMSSKWPMIELELLTKSAEVIPLFYKLAPRDLKSPTKLLEWRKKWEEMAQKDGSLDIRGWENAVNHLATQTGEIYRSGSEGDYLTKVVRAICMKIAPHVPYDLAYARGHQRLIQEVEERFHEALVACKASSNTPIIGMHGVGGLGKTTLCKVMANYYIQGFCGKASIIRFPTREDEVSTVEECKRALKQLICISEHFLENLHSFDQVVQVMKERMKSEAVFLALDNVSDHSLEETRRILEVGFGANSRVLVTSRSQALLEDLLDKAHVRPIPSMNEGEAVETFQASFGADLSFASKELLGHVVSLCLFNGSYNPLALKALGQRLKRMGGSNASAIEQNLEGITFSLRDSQLERLIKINYDGMTSIAQRMFLDVAVIFRRTGSFFLKGHVEMRYKEMCEWLSILYEGEIGEDEIHDQMYELAFNGLLQIEEEAGRVRRLKGHCKGRVVVHDLYVDLAERLAAASPRILVAGSSNMQAVRWAELERVVLDSKIEDAVEFLHKDCRKLQLLYASEQRFSEEEGLQLRGAKALRLLKVENCIGKLRGLKAVPKLAVLGLWDEAKDAEVQPKARAGFRAVEDVSSCGELKSLVLHGNAMFHGAKNDADYFRRLTNLKYLRLHGWRAGLKKLPDLTASVHLELVMMRRSPSLEEIEGALPPSLEILELGGCASLRRVPDLGVFAQLRALLIENSESLIEIQGLPPNLQMLDLKHCANLQRIPDLVMQAQLRVLQVRSCGCLKEIRGVLTSSLERIVVVDCASVQRIPELDERAQLLELRVIRCRSLEKIPGFFPSNLETIVLRDCRSLQRIPNLDGRTQLRTVDVRNCGLLEDHVWGVPWR